MNGVTISDLRKEPEPVQVAVQSLEGDMYIAYAMREDAMQAILRDSGDRLLARSIDQMHSFLRDVPIAGARLMMDSPYDEMIGISSSRGVVGMPLAW